MSEQPSVIIDSAGRALHLINCFDSAFKEYVRASERVEDLRDKLKNAITVRNECDDRKRSAEKSLIGEFPDRAFLVSGVFYETPNVTEPERIENAFVRRVVPISLR